MSGLHLQGGALVFIIGATLLVILHKQCSFTSTDVHWPHTLVQPRSLTVSGIRKPCWSSYALLPGSTTKDDVPQAQWRTVLEKYNLIREMVFNSQRVITVSV
ncbi:hypothetical protein DPMN_053439 [Dreissena polymorpha]|uniref:Uncharacterized protein n=1 Tax=Dreissena polymorpha TaxID=45954 RepID=A0A9D4CLC6_DREPO|nr:hypothetical protein DPMN_053439 [Dreissena polymorpha]